MNDTLKQLALGLAGGLVPPVANARRSAAGGIVIAVLAITAYVALLGSAWVLVEPKIGPLFTWLALAAISIAGALIAWAVTRHLNAKARALAEAQRAAAMDALLARTAATALVSAPQVVRDHPYLAALGAAGIAGLAYVMMPPKTP